MNTNPTATLLTVAFILVFASIARSTIACRTDHVHHFSTFNPTTFCKHIAPYKSLCTKAVLAAHSLSMSSPVMVVKVNVNKAVEDAQRALAKVSLLTVGRRNKYPGMTGSVLHSCKENYNSAVTALRETQRILNSHGNHGDLMNELTAACTFVETCTDDLNAVPEMKYPIQHLHKELEHDLRNCMDLAAVLK